MEKHSTEKPRKTLAPETLRLIRRSYGMKAAIARAGGFNRSYVTRVLGGARPPSAKFLQAVALAFTAATKRAELEVLRAEMPQLFPGRSSCGPREMGAR